MNVPDDLKYTPTHEYIRIEGDIGTVGITDHAQAELTDIVYVELPEAGKTVKAEAALCAVESVKAATEIYSPVSGEIVEVNAALESDPGLLNQQPFGEDGWIFKIRMSDPAEVKALLDAGAYRELIS